MCTGQQWCFFGLTILAAALGFAGFYLLGDGFSMSTTQTMEMAGGAAGGAGVLGGLAMYCSEENQDVEPAFWVGLVPTAAGLGVQVVLIAVFMIICGYWIGGCNCDHVNYGEYCTGHAGRACTSATVGNTQLWGVLMVGIFGVTTIGGLGFCGVADGLSQRHTNKVRAKREARRFEEFEAAAAAIRRGAEDVTPATITKPVETGAPEPDRSHDKPETSHVVPAPKTSAVPSDTAGATSDHPTNTEDGVQMVGVNGNTEQRSLLRRRLHRIFYGISKPSQASA